MGKHANGCRSRAAPGGLRRPSALGMFAFRRPPDTMEPMEDASGTPESVPSRSRRKDPGRPSGPAKATAKRARPRAAAKAVSRTKTASRSQAAAGRHRCPTGRGRGGSARGRPWRRYAQPGALQPPPAAGRRALAPGHPTRCFDVLPSRPRAGRPGRLRAGGGRTAGCSIGTPRPCSSWPAGSRATPTGEPGDPAAMRSQLTRMARLAMPVRTDVHATGRVIRTPGGSTAIPVRIYRQFGTGIGRIRPPAIVYFHGGGWVTGDLDSHDSSCRLLAAASGCIVVAVAYRLAPEDPFPAAVDDALEAYAWVQRNSDEVGHAEGQVGVMGDSAGGNLAAVVAMETRRGNGRRIGRPRPGGPGVGLPRPRCPSRLGVGAVDGRGIPPHHREHGVLPELLRPRPLAVGEPEGVASAGRRPSRSGAGAGGDRRLRPAPGRRGRVRRGTRQGRRRGRVPLLRRPGPRVHGHGDAARLPGPGHRGLRRHGPA